MVVGVVVGGFVECVECKAPLITFASDHQNSNDSNGKRREFGSRSGVSSVCWGGLQRSCTTICCCILDKINEFNCPFHRKQLYPQNQAFAHAHIIAHFCNGFHNSLIQIHRAGFLPFFRHFYKLFHDVAFFLRCTLY